MVIREPTLGDAILDRIVHERYDQGGGLALQEISRKKPVLNNRVPQEIEDAIVARSSSRPSARSALPTNCANTCERALYPPHSWASNFPQF